MEDDRPDRPEADSPGSEALNQPESPTEQSTITALPDTGDPQRIGPYRILQKIGEGGMGIVYEAEQETPVRRRVALKLIKWGMDTKQVVARFEAERQALALMNHPNVAKVLDAGATPEGRPYFVMEYVKGVPITEHCDRQRLTTRERLELFMQACEGVQHAHQKGIIHRDIKPSNILVEARDGKAAPKIIDFGVAKATEHRLTERTLFTELGQLVGTPEYMSPEQAEMTHQDIDTRTDVYSLGVVLYELLVGALPFDPKELREGGFDEIRRRIREDEPSKPSTRVSTLGHAATDVARARHTDVGALAKRLRGELDWITMKALEKNPARRYPSASEFAADVGRHLEHEVVLAGPPGGLYRVKKVISRHKLGLGLAASALIVLLVLAVMMTSQMALVAERDRAHREIATARGMLDFLVEMFRVSEPSQARANTLLAREVLDKGAENVRGAFAEAPEIQGRLMTALGRIYGNLGLYDEASSLLEQALGILPQELGEGHVEVVRARTNLARILRDTGDYDDALASFEQALAVLETEVGPDDPEVADLLNDMAGLMVATGKYESATELYERALAVREKSVGPNHPEVAASLTNLSIALRRAGRYDQALPLAQRALRIQEEELDNNHPALLESLNNLGNLHFRMGDVEPALPLYERALRMREEVFGPEHPLVASALNNLAATHWMRKDYAAARPLFERSLRVREKTHGPDHPRTAVAVNNLAELFREIGEYEQATSLFERALVIREGALGPEHPSVASTLGAFADLLVKTGEYARAREYYDRAYRILEQTRGPDSPLVAHLLAGIGDLSVEIRDYRSAWSNYERARRICQEKLPAGHPEFTRLLFKMGRLAAIEGDDARALDFLHESMAQGFAEPEMLEDDAFDALRGDPEFEALFAEVKKRVGE